MSTFYIGVDFHPHQQTVAWIDLATGEVKTQQLLHNTPSVKAFYETMPKAIVGIEASSQAVWFEALLSELGHQLQVGNPTTIRARARSRTSPTNVMPSCWWTCYAKMNFLRSGGDQRPANKC